MCLMSISWNHYCLDAQKFLVDKPESPRLRQAIIANDNLVIIVVCNLQALSSPPIIKLSTVARGHTLQMQKVISKAVLGRQ